ncbi:DUF4902 domain-containing protein [Vibrio tubiashii]|uniref:DUF4902 domain-containing protein n=1 Tax=Vibrio tubiashii TaxID=29498 RepID=UPI001EFD137D|nr:DUF4902 domain-containing protein [Vibrio tubiashii]
MTINTQNKTDLRSISDGPIKVTVEKLRKVNMTLFEAGLYEDLDLQSFTNCETQMTGYAEWSSDTQPKLSIGIDWAFLNGKYQIDGNPFANFIIQSSEGIDLPKDESLLQTKHFLNERCWYKSLIEKLDNTYS